MSDPVIVPCELHVIPGGCSARQNRFRLAVSGETVFDNYESYLTPAQLDMVKQIVKAHARLLVKWADG